MSNLSFEDAVLQCQMIVCDDSNVLWLGDRLDTVVEKVKSHNPQTRVLTPAEEAAVSLLEQAFQNSGVPPRYYSEFIRMLNDGIQPVANRLIGMHTLKHARMNRTAHSSARISDR